MPAGGGAMSTWDKLPFQCGKRSTGEPMLPFIRSPTVPFSGAARFVSAPTATQVFFPFPSSKQSRRPVRGGRVTFTIGARIVSRESILAFSWRAPKRKAPSVWRRPSVSARSMRPPFNRRGRSNASQIRPMAASTAPPVNWLATVCLPLALPYGLIRTAHKFQRQLRHLRG